MAKKQYTSPTISYIGPDMNSDQLEAAVPIAAAVAGSVAGAVASAVARKVFN